MFGFSILYFNQFLFPIQGAELINYIYRDKLRTITFGYSCSAKFENDKIFVDQRDYIIGIDGVILNLIKLKNHYGISDYFNLVIHLWEKKKSLFPNYLKGEFNGFIFDKQKEELFVFSNQLATKQLYYASCKESFVISPDIGLIVNLRESLKIDNILNKNAVYSMLTFGSMIENETLVNGIYRLHAGEFISIIKDNLSVNKYHNFNNVNISINKSKEAIALLENSFNEALELEYEKDKEYNYAHLATLSGGLDSRLNIMLSHEKGNKIDTFCFSQSNYLDNQIACEIATELNLSFQFISLDEGNYLTNLSDNVRITNGTLFYLSSAHFNFALSKINLKNYGLIHTGQIGDGVLGGFVSNKKNNNYLSKTISSKLIHKMNLDKKVLDKYSSEETFKLLNRICNLTNSGSFVVENNGTYLVSPYMDTEFVTNCLSISPELKKNGKLYLEWINKLHPKIAKYKWERTGFTPTHLWKTKLSRYTNKVKLEYYKFLKKENQLSMTPLDYWYRNNELIKSFYLNFYQNNIYLINDNILKKDLDLMFNNGNVIEKSMMLTILEFIKQHKIKV